MPKLMVMMMVMSILVVMTMVPMVMLVMELSPEYFPRHAASAHGTDHDDVPVERLEREERQEHCDAQKWPRSVRTRR